jgi:amino acid transporter
MNTNPKLIAGGVIAIVGVVLLFQALFGPSIIYESMCSSPPGVTEPAECGEIEPFIIMGSIVVITIGVAVGFLGMEQ